MWRAAYEKGRPLATTLQTVCADFLFACDAGEVKGQLFPDVKRNFDKWIARGMKVRALGSGCMQDARCLPHALCDLIAWCQVAIYSSGSIEAQKLLFQYTDTVPDRRLATDGRRVSLTCLSSSSCVAAQRTRRHPSSERLL
jgi:methionine salvage enolase-phosphatase E1